MGPDRVLVVDFDPAICAGVCSFLRGKGFVVSAAGNCRDAMAQFHGFRPHAVVLDGYSPSGEVPQLLLKARNMQPKIPVLLLDGVSGRGLEAAISQSADEVLAKPVDLVDLHAAVSRMLTKTRRRIEGQPGSAAGDGLNPFVGRSAAILRLREMASRIVASQSPVLIEGETGSGKGVLARWIHQNSLRAGKPFLDLNCAGLSRELLESELFGHQKGAFTSAISAKQGLLEVADGGTLFLDEIGDMDLHVQSKLLKVLEDRVFRRLGDVRDRAVDMRLISATHRELRELVQEKRFREDLYYRVNIVWLTIPPLRRRAEDIAALTEHLLRNIGRQWGREKMQVSPSALHVLQSHPWPGNIRELRNVLERALLLADSDVLQPKHLQFESGAAKAAFAPEANHGTLKQMERAYICHVLEAEQGSIERTARYLGIPRSSLYNKMRRLEIPQGTGRTVVELSSAAD